MRTSSKKTTSAVLRSIIGIKDVEMAEILDCSPGTIHSLESGRLKLSDSLAMRMAHETGVAMNWLLDGNPKALPRARNGTPFSRAVFDRVRSSKLPTPFSRALVPVAVREFSEALASIMYAAYAKGDAELATYKIGRSIVDLAKEFGGERAKHWESVTEALRNFFAYPERVSTALTQSPHQREKESLAVKKPRRKKRSSPKPGRKA
jgi:hypothetical protein